jgi:hypothetical protein
VALLVGLVLSQGKRRRSSGEKQRSRVRRPAEEKGRSSAAEPYAQQGVRGPKVGGGDESFSGGL